MVVRGRPEMMAALSQIVVIPFATNVRGLPWDVVSTNEMGWLSDVRSARSGFAQLPRVDLGARITTFPETRWPELARAVLAEPGLAEDEK